MRISIIIPAHNEEKYLAQCLDSFIAQTQQPKELIVVDDNSSDKTFKIASKFSKEHPWIKVFQRKSSDEHIPGKKVVDTFNYGLKKASEYDLIGKFDADIILPPNYFEQMRNHFQSSIKNGLVYEKSKNVRTDNLWLFRRFFAKPTTLCNQGRGEVYKATTLERCRRKIILTLNQ